MKRKQSIREKMGCFWGVGGRVPNRLSYNGAPVVSNCSIIRMPGMMVVMMVIMIMFRAGQKRRRWPSH